MMSASLIGSLSFGVIGCLVAVLSAFALFLCVGRDKGAKQNSQKEADVERAVDGGMVYENTSRLHLSDVTVQLPSGDTEKHGKTRKSTGKETQDGGSSARPVPPAKPTSQHIDGMFGDRPRSGNTTIHAAPVVKDKKKKNASAESTKTPDDLPNHEYDNISPNHPKTTKKEKESKSKKDKESKIKKDKDHKPKKEEKKKKSTKKPDDEPNNVYKNIENAPKPEVPKKPGSAQNGGGQVYENVPATQVQPRYTVPAADTGTEYSLVQPTKPPKKAKPVVPVKPTQYEAVQFSTRQGDDSDSD